MSQILFSSLQFKFAQWHTEVMKKKKAKHKESLNMFCIVYMDRVKRIWYAVSPEPPLLAHTSSESRGTFRQKARSLAPLNGWACAVKICHDGMLEDTNWLDGAHIQKAISITKNNRSFQWLFSLIALKPGL